MSKVKAVSKTPETEAEWGRRVDPSSQVSGALPAMHSRFGTPLPESMRPTREQIKAANALPDLSDERQREIQAELDALLRPRRR